MSWVVDASVAVEALLRTEVGERVWAVIGDDDLLAPDLLDTEVLSVLRRENLAGRLDDERAAEALSDLHDWDIERIESRVLVAEAWRYRHNLSAYDALYVAATAVHGSTLITADGPLARAPGIGVPIHNVRA